MKKSGDSMRYVLFGTGDYYRRFRHWFQNENVLAVLDNDPGKQGSSIDGWPVISPNDVGGLSFDAIVMLSFYAKEMREQLEALGVPSEKIYHFFDLHELFPMAVKKKSVLLLSHDLSLGGPALALYHAAIALRNNGYEVVYASMVDGGLRTELERSFIPVIIDERLQIASMRELIWTWKFDLIICNTISFHTFLSDRNEDVPIIWWLHDSAFFYEGIRKEKLEKISSHNLKCLSVGPVPGNAMKNCQPGMHVDELVYGVSEDV